jgi:hypothetical protein
VIWPHVPVQLTSHAHALWQVISPHAALPRQVTEHRSLLQSIDPHALLVAHLIVQSAPLQCRSPHDPEVGHVMSHCIPFGHQNELPPVPDGIWHVGGVVDTSHEAQPLGQLESTTQ